MKVCVTGHRPDKLYGYDLNHKNYTKLKKLLKDLLVDLGCTEAISGMALGVDTLYALAVLELRDEGYPIKLHCAIPCKNHCSAWSSASRKQYADILAKADKVVLVSDEEYKPWLMQKRNEYMVDRADKVIAVWNGTSGGTANCVKYAKAEGKHIIRITPK